MAISSVSNNPAPTFTPEELAVVKSFAESWGSTKLQHDDGVNRSKTQELMQKSVDEDDDEEE